MFGLKTTVIVYNAQPLLLDHGHVLGQYLITVVRRVKAHAWVKDHFPTFGKSRFLFPLWVKAIPHFKVYARNKSPTIYQVRYGNYYP